MFTFERIKRMYEWGWTVDMVGDAVRLGHITPEQFTEITGVEYTGQSSL